MIAASYRPTVATIDLDAIRYNVRRKIQDLHKEQKLYAVVKANAYGHGMVKVAQAASEAGAKGFCVALLEEALELRNAGLTQPVLILGSPSPKVATQCALHHIRCTVTSIAWCEQAKRHMQEFKERYDEISPLRLHLAIDTGMGRLGLRKEEQIREFDRYMRENAAYFTLEGVYTHFARADEPDKSFTEKQLKQFEELCSFLQTKAPFAHTSNSAFALWHNHEKSSIIRYGAGMYGLNPSNGDLAAPHELRPALRLESMLIYVKRLHKGDTVSYGGEYVCREDEWIGTVPIGYADGWLRDYRAQDVLIKGKFCKVVGRICMDQLMVRLPEQYAVGTKVTFIGKDGDKEIRVEDIARAANTIGYEVLCTISERVKREYEGE